jgi:hypothetical protein
VNKYGEYPGTQKLAEFAGRHRATALARLALETLIDGEATGHHGWNQVRRIALTRQVARRWMRPGEMGKTRDS